jgi:hypothetical protein
LRVTGQAITLGVRGVHFPLRVLHRRAIQPTEARMSGFWSVNGRTAAIAGLLVLIVGCEPARVEVPDSLAQLFSGELIVAPIKIEGGSGGQVRIFAVLPKAS